MARKRKYELKKTGLKFTYGESMRPKWDDLRHAVLILDRADLGRFLWPTMNIGMGTANRNQIEAAVPEILSNARFILPRFDLQQKALLWLIAWYNHIWMGGTRPDMRSRPRLKWSIPSAIFKCPMCGDHWYPPRRVKTQGAAIRAFAVWMKSHSRVKYHDGVRTKRLAYRVEEFPVHKALKRIKKERKRR